MATAPKSNTGKKKPAPADETKSAKFSRLASSRVSAAVKKINQVGNLSGPGYERTPEQITAIGNHLKNAVNLTLAKFAPKEAGAAKEPEIKI